MALHESVSPNSTPKKSRNGHKTHNKDKKNPYSDRGLDKFSALLTDLDEKRKKIYSQTDPEEIVMVRFAYKNSDECVPVVVKQKDKKEEKNTSDSEAMAIKPKQSKQPTTNKNNIVRARNLRRLNKPSYYIAAVVILILFLLSIFGRSVTILCTCIVWYLVPVLKQSLSKSRRKGKVRISIPNKMEKQPEASSVLSSSSSSSPIQAHRKIG